MQSIQDRVLKVLAEQITGRTDTVHLIKPEHHLYQDLHCDSIELMEAIIGLEEEFTIRLADEVIQKLTTVQQIIDHVKDVCTARDGEIARRCCCAQEGDAA